MSKDRELFSNLILDYQCESCERVTSSRPDCDDTTGIYLKVTTILISSKQSRNGDSLPTLYTFYQNIRRVYFYQCCLIYYFALEFISLDFSVSTARKRFGFYRSVGNIINFKHPLYCSCDLSSIRVR